MSLCLSFEQEESCIDNYYCNIVYQTTFTWNCYIFYAICSNIDPMLPQPAFKALSRNLNKIYCEVCVKRWDKKNRKRSKLLKIDKIKLKDCSEKWSLVEVKMDSSRDDDIFVCASCRSMFFKEDYLKAQNPTAEQDMDSIENQMTTSSPDIPPPPQLPVRSSARKRCAYETRRDIEEKRQCTICCETKKDAKGRLVPVRIITLRSMETNKHLAEETLKKFSSIHLMHGTKYKDAAERIMLIDGTTSLFTADVGYHSYCYKLFRSSHWEDLEAPIHAPKTSSLPQAASFSILCDLVRLHVICRREIYSLTDLKTAYESMKTENCPALRVVEMLKQN